MEKMIGSLSNLPEKLELNLKDVDLNVLVNNVLENIALDGIKRVVIEKRLESIPFIRADVEEFYKVVHNLIINGYEALNESGQISVKTYERRGHVVMSVHDNGVGMDREFMNNSLFKPFRTTKKKGLGVGLYQCKTIVEAHGGEILVESETGKGSTFNVYLPIRH